MNIPEEFNDIRPYSPEELPQVFRELIADASFQSVVKQIYPDVPFEAIAQKMLACRDNMDFQRTFAYPLVEGFAKKSCSSLGGDFSSLQNKNQAYTFISNHRDIILDSAFLSYLLIDRGFKTVEIAIGDNLLAYPWIMKIVRVNKAFIVQRGLTMHEMLESSKRMSAYIHFAVNEKKENIWIAQREGRAKDSNDQTQDSVLKMLAMGGEGCYLERLRALNIVPLSISYEYDPCDYLKAREFQLKRDMPDYKKTKEDDLLNMGTGLYGFKGHVHFQAATSLNDFLDTRDPEAPKGSFFREVAEEIDRRIYQGYRFFPGNYVAADLLSGGQRFADRYSNEEKERFTAYLNTQLNKIILPQKDEPFLRERMLTMYANPLFNYLRVTKQD